MSPPYCNFLDERLLLTSKFLWTQFLKKVLKSKFKLIALTFLDTILIFLSFNVIITFANRILNFRLRHILYAVSIWVNYNEQCLLYEKKGDVYETPQHWSISLKNCICKKWHLACSPFCFHNINVLLPSEIHIQLLNGS